MIPKQQALSEKHLAIFRRHMVDVIGIHAELSAEEIGKSELVPQYKKPRQSRGD